MKKIRLLIIDEHRAVRRALGVRLRSSAEIDVLAAAVNASEGHNFIKDELPSAVLFGLKSTRGRELDSTISAVAELAGKGLPVIVLASYSDDIERELLLQAGASRYLLKDINSTQLIDEIRAVVSTMTP
jgi:DNA-binding NarL/FixJ family response regulator